MSILWNPLKRPKKEKHTVGRWFWFGLDKKIHFWNFPMFFRQPRAAFKLVKEYRDFADTRKASLLMYKEIEEEERDLDNAQRLVEAIFINLAKLQRPMKAITHWKKKMDAEFGDYRDRAGTGEATEPGAYQNSRGNRGAATSKFFGIGGRVKINYYLWRIQRSQILGDRYNKELKRHIGELGEIMARLKNRESLAARVARNTRIKWQEYQHENDALIKMMRDKWGVTFKPIGAPVQKQSP